jgi:hypothetical protein
MVCKTYPSPGIAAWRALPKANHSCAKVMEGVCDRLAS